MIVIFFLIPLSIVIAAGFLAGFIWAVRSGQYEDTCTPSMRLLWEESKSISQAGTDVLANQEPQRIGGSPAVPLPQPNVGETTTPT